MADNNIGTHFLNILLLNCCCVSQIGAKIYKMAGSLTKKKNACKSLEEEIILLHSQEMLFLEARKLCYKVKIMRFFFKCVFAIFAHMKYFFFQTISTFWNTHTLQNQSRDKV